MGRYRAAFVGVAVGAASAVGEAAGVGSMVEITVFVGGGIGGLVCVGAESVEDEGRAHEEMVNNRTIIKKTDTLRG